jgi:hypothetical protein
VIDDDRIPTSTTYREVGIHSGQRAKRVAEVKQAIDVVHEISDPDSLLAILSDPQTPPEARVLAGTKILAPFDEAANSRVTRPRGIDLGAVRGTVAS